MADVSGLVRDINRGAVSAVLAEKPCEVLFGTVKNDAPLEILVEQKFTLGEAQLIIPKALTEYELEITMDEVKKKITIHNALKSGEMVVLIRAVGGQVYYVADRVVSE